MKVVCPDIDAGKKEFDIEDIGVKKMSYGIIMIGGIVVTINTSISQQGVTEMLNLAKTGDSMALAVAKPFI